MSYITPSQDIRETLIADGLVSQEQIYFDFLPDPQTAYGNPNIVATVLQTGGNSNPRWLRDEIFLSIQVIGKDRNQVGECRNKIWELYNALLGRPTFIKGDYAYLQFNSVNTPTFVGYQENSKPLFTCSISLVRESQVKEGNRDPLC